MLLIIAIFSVITALSSARKSYIYFFYFCERIEDLLKNKINQFSENVNARCYLYNAVAGGVGNQLMGTLDLVQTGQQLRVLLAFL